jgi:hypothetical protein
MRSHTDHRSPTARRPAHMPRAIALRDVAPRPVCDGCRDPAAGGPWHVGDDGAQFCARCRARIGVWAR